MKAVSDLVSPLSGEVLEVNEEVVDAPELVNDDPYGAGWLVRIRLARRRRGRRAARRRRLPRAARRRLMARGLDEPGTHPYLSLTDADRREMLTAIGVETVEELFRDIPAGVRFGGQLELEPALSELELVRDLGALAARNVATWARSSRSSAPGSTTTTCRRSSTRFSPAASCSPRTRPTSRR